MRFNNKIFLPIDEIKSLNSEDIKNSTHDKYRNNFIEVHFNSGEYYGNQTKSFDWQVIAAAEKRMDLKVKFDDPLIMSQKDVPDRLRVVLNLEDFFDLNCKSLKNGTEIFYNIPRQIIDEDQAKLIDGYGSVIANTQITIISGNFFVNSALMLSLNQLWSAINGLQLTTHLPLLNTKFPANAGLFFRHLTEVSTFDVLPHEELLASLTNFPEKESHSLAFESSGYENLFLAENMGSGFLMVHLFFIVCILIFVVTCAARKSPKTLKYTSKINNRLYFSIPLRFLYESYLETIISIAIDLYHFNSNDVNGSVIYD